MIGIVIHLEDRWNYVQSDRDIDIMQMFQETISAFGADTFIIVDKTTEGMVHTSYRLDLSQVVFKTLNEVLRAYPDATKLYFEHTNAILDEISYTTLEELVHPKDNVLYIFGGDEHGLDLANIDLTGDNKVVSILVPKQILWTIVAMTIALYDRLKKVG